MDVCGVEPDSETRCAHYRGQTDRIAIRFRCCGRYFCCHRCHDALDDHVPDRWPAEEFGKPAVLCGACRGELTIREYLEGGAASCPRCRAEFNPRCAFHHHLYFEVE